MSKPLTVSLENRIAVIVIASLLVGIGIYSFLQLKVEAYPDISDVQVVVIAQFPGHAAEEMEQQVTIPIERALNGVPKVIGRRSRTIFGLAVVELTFSDDADDYFARQLVVEKLKDAELPDGVSTQLGPLSSGIGEMYRYRLVDPKNDSLRLRELQDWVVVPKLLQVPGVADVAPFGGLIKQFQIQIDPVRLEKYGMSISQVAQSVAANNRNAGGAMLDNGQQSMVVRGMGQVTTASDIGNIVLDASRGVPIYVRDIGDVKIGSAPLTGIFGMNEATGGVEGIVLMRRWENPSEVLRGLHEAIDDLNENRLPRDVKIETIYDRTELVNNTLRTVGRTLLEGLVIVTGVLLLFLGNFRAAILTAIVIPISLLFAFTIMHLVGIPANLLSLGALDFGIIVDGTLVLVEHLFWKLKSPIEGRPHIRLIEEAASEIERPIFFSLVILISAYIPLFTLERVERRLFAPMAFTVFVALLGSLILTLTLVPVLATYLFKGEMGSWRNPALTWVYGQFERLLSFALERSRTTAAIAGGIVVIALIVASALGTEFLPQLDEGVIWIRCNLPAGISLDKSAETANKIRSIIKQFPEVSLVISQSGRNDSGTDPFGPNRNEFLVGLKPYDAWPSGHTKATLVEGLGQSLRGQIPGGTFNFTQPIIDTSTEMATGSSADLAVIIKGSDLPKLRAFAEQTLGMLKHVPGAVDTSIEQEADQAQLRIAVDRQKVSRYGLNVNDIQTIVEMAIGGQPVGKVYEGERSFDITVRYVSDARADATSIGRILVTTKDGGKVPLSDLAEVHIQNGASIIARGESSRQISVRTNIRGRDQGGFVSEAQDRFAAQIPLPPGYSVEWGGQFQNLYRARRRLSFVLPVTIAIIFALLFTTFKSAKYAGLVLISVPFSMVGGIFALYLRGMHLSVSAAIGFISLFGVSVMSGVLVISEINRLCGENVPLLEAVRTGTTNQIRPVFMMIVAALLGMTPAATAHGIGSDVQKPLATVLVGGLLSTLFLTLLTMPALYLIVEERLSRQREGHQ